MARACDVDMPKDDPAASAVSRPPPTSDQSNQRSVCRAKGSCQSKAGPTTKSIRLFTAPSTFGHSSLFCSETGILQWRMPLPLVNSRTRFGTVVRSLHWLTALLILTAIPLGLYANSLPHDTSDALGAKAQVFSLHKTLGVAAFFVALVRILWALTQPRPVPLHPDHRVETAMAGLVHWISYISLLAVPLPRGRTGPGCSMPRKTAGLRGTRRR